MLLRLRRIGSLALFLALLGGGLGLPLFDAVVFHGQPLPAARGTLSSDGAPQGHTQLCILDQAGLLTPAIRSAGHQISPVVPSSTTTQQSPELSGLNRLLLFPRPRAPPLG